MSQKPSVGRIVHYQSYGTPLGEYTSQPRAAVITELYPHCENEAPLPDMTVGLCILNPTGLFFTKHVQYSEEPRPGCWSWPPRA
jgi:hypothetical protein